MTRSQTVFVYPDVGGVLEVLFGQMRVRNTRVERAGILVAAGALTLPQLPDSRQGIS